MPKVLGTGRKSAKFCRSPIKISNKSDLLKVIRLAPVVQKVDSDIYRINYYPVNSTIGFANTYPLDSNLSGG